jgi:hypothetical protein
LQSRLYYIFSRIVTACTMERRFTIETDLETGVVVRETYRLDGQRHRDPKEGPAYVWCDSSDGTLIEECYCWHGRLHREDGPARIGYEYGEKGTTVAYEMYYRHGVMHRDPKQGPAWINYNTGAVASEIYYRNGEPHRDPADGPYLIERIPSGDIHKKKYLEINGDHRPRRFTRKRLGSPPAP